MSQEEFLDLVVLYSKPVLQESFLQKHVCDPT